MIIAFEDFRNLALDNNRRIYYFQRENILELCYITEGIYIKSFVNLDTVPVKESFFSDDLFVGATRLLFRIPDGNGDIRMINDIIPKTSVVEENKTEENEYKETDLQKEGTSNL